jgi:hypothetical protein
MISQAPECAQCHKPFNGMPAYQRETHSYVAAGKFPTLDFCHPGCAYAFAFGHRPKIQCEGCCAPPANLKI